MVSPPKPWERAGTIATTATAPTTAMATTATPAPAQAANTADGGTAPAVPARPSNLGASSTLASTSAYTSPYSAMGYNRFGSYGSSPYSSYGGYGSSMYGGGMYGGGMYGGMGGYGGTYGGGYGMGGPMGMMNPMDPNNPSLTQSLEASTAQTFAVLQSIVQTFGGFAQMLESTFMATHSSFFAMIGVAEQLGNLRNAIGTVLGLFGLVRWLRDTLTGRRSAPGLGNEFQHFVNRPPGAQPPPNPNAPRASRKPVIIFLLAMFGIPYLMHRLIRSLQQRLPPPPGPLNPLDPNTLQFARAMYTFSTSEPLELAMQKGDVVAVLETRDPMTGMESEWWRGRNRAGQEGMFPRNYVEVVKRPGQEVKIEPPAKTVD